MTPGDGGGEVDERHPELKSEEIRIYRVTVGCGERTENMPSVKESPFRIWPTQFLTLQTQTQPKLAAEHNIEGFTTQMVEVGPVKKARVHDGDHWAEKGTRLVKLVDRRRVDLEKHVTHTAHLEKEARRPCCSICDKGVNGSRQAAPETKAPRQIPKPRTWIVEDLADAGIFTDAFSSAAVAGARQCLHSFSLLVLYSSQFLCDETAAGLLSNDTKHSLGFLRTQILGLRMQAAATEPGC